MATGINEQAIVFAAKNGNERCFEELYRLYYQKVYALARATLKNDDDAEDVLQLTFIAAWKNMASLEDDSAFNTWIQRITLNQCYTLLRKNKPEVSLDDNDDDEHGAEEIESDLMLPEVYSQREDLRVRLGNIINSLSDTQRQTIQLYYYDELSVDEIAGVMDCGAGTVKSRLFLARKAIRTEIEEIERKTGQKFYSVAGIPLIAFSWIYKQQAESVSLASGKAGSIFSEICRNLDLNTAATAAQVSASEAAETAAGKAIKPAASAARAAARTAAVGTAKKAASALAVRIAIGVLSAAVVAGGCIVAVKKLRERSEASEAVEETEISEKKPVIRKSKASKKKSSEPVSKAEPVKAAADDVISDEIEVKEVIDMTGAYCAYIDILRENRESIVAAGAAYTGFQEPVAVCNVMGDDIPELIFVSYDVEKYEGYLSVYGYQNGEAECVSSENISKWEEGYGTFTQLRSLFFKEDRVYAIREGGADTIAFYIHPYDTSESFTALEDEKPLSYTAVYHIEGDDADYDRTYYAGGESVTQDQFSRALSDFSEKIDCVILSDHRLSGGEYEPYMAAEEKVPCLGMDCDTAIAYLESLLGTENNGGVKDDEIFSRLDGITFVFASGVGAWGTVLNIAKDGSFTGNYHDSNMGETGEGYPDGTCLICDFHGKFKNVRQIDEYTYSLELDNLEYEGTPEEYCEDGILYVPTDAYGIAGGTTFMLYLPGAVVNDLPGSFIEWISMPNAWPSYKIPATLPFFGLYNVEEECGFYGQIDD